MVALVLGAVGTAVGGAIGGSFLGMSTAAIGGMIGSSLGGMIDQQLFSKSNDSTSWGDPLTNAEITESKEGVPVPRLSGRNRLSGHVIWQTKYLERLKTTTTTTGGKGGGGGGTTVTQNEYVYSCSFAIAICEGEVHSVGRVWADGNLVDLERDSEEGNPVHYTIYYGTEDQQPDSHIESKEGVGLVPAYRGLCYVVFKELPLAGYGNRIPQLSFEVTRVLGIDDPDRMERQVRAVTVGPGMGEFVYATEKVTLTSGTLPYHDPATGNLTTDGGDQSETNKSNTFQNADFPVSLDQMQAAMPYTKSANFTVAWFGDDLRAGNCTVRPKIEDSANVTDPLTWAVAGYTRASATEVSRTSTRLNYGGTPSDNAVSQGIAELKARNIDVVFCPVILMDIQAGNTLPNPYSNNAATVGQPAHPWAGKITCSPAPGYTGSPEGTATVATQVNAFWAEYEAMVLHYAQLCATAGGVDAFLIGSGLAGLTQIRNSDTGYTFVANLVQLAADVSVILGSSVKVSYAADWTEWNTHFPGDGGRLLFHLDALWASPDVDFIGINNHMPLSDWRDGTNHLDYVEGRSIYSLEYLKANIEGGEYYDYTYASISARNTQTRTPITDDVIGKPWVFRKKDIRNWWMNQHYNRYATGNEYPSPTAWVPQSKPIWWTSIGCPAIDKGTNQPSAFHDPKSDDSAFPYYSHGWRDDVAMRAFIGAHAKYWDDPGLNLVSTQFAGRMVTREKQHIRTWDARPFPFFPKFSTKWTDAANWGRGSWLNGRAGMCDVKDVISDIMSRQNFTNYDASEVNGMITGYNLDKVISARGAIDTLAKAFFFDGIESEGRIVFKTRARDAVGYVTSDDLIVGENDTPDNPKSFSMTRKQESELPAMMRVTYYDEAGDYRQAQAYSRRVTTQSKKESQASIPFVMEQAQAVAVAEAYMIEEWVARETGTFTLPPNMLQYEPGDVIEARLGSREWRLRIDKISEAHIRQVEVTQVARSTYDLRPGPMRYYDNKMQAIAGTTSGSGGYGYLTGSFVGTQLTVLINTSQATLVVGSEILSATLPAGTTIVSIDGVSGVITLSNAATVDGEYDFIVTGQSDPYVNAPGSVGYSLTSSSLFRAVFAIVDHPVLASDGDMDVFRIAAYMGPWRDQIVTKETAVGNVPLTFEGISSGVVTSPNLIGALVVAQAGTSQPLTWDFDTELNVALHGTTSELLSQTPDAVLQGFNTAFIEHTTGEWEVFQFVYAVLQPDGTYTLKQLLRGQAGTEYLVGNDLVYGARVVFSDPRPSYFKLPSSEMNVAVQYSLISDGNTFELANTQTRVKTLKGAGRRPYSPCQPRMYKLAGSTTRRITWLRRARRGGDDWTPVDVPDIEPVHQFRLRILAGPGGAIKRTIILTNQEYWDYSLALQNTDFGSERYSLTVAIAHYGSDYGDYGPDIEETITLRGTI